jgi:hypothetical protein
LKTYTSAIKTLFPSADLSEEEGRNPKNPKNPKIQEKFKEINL